MSLKLLFNSPKGYRPKPGQIYLMHTSAGLIPAGVTSNNATVYGAIMLHLYRALVHDPAETSYYPLVSRNELLIPPVLIAKRDFKEGGGFTRNTDKNAPTPIAFDKYYKYVASATWDPVERAFVPGIAPLPHDRIGDFVPKERRSIQYIEIDKTISVNVDAVPEEAYFMADMILHDVHLEFALEDSLAYHQLIDTPRPPHPDMVGAKEAREKAAALEAAALNTKETTMQSIVNLTDDEGTTSVIFSQDQLPDDTLAAIYELDEDYLPNGYFFEYLVAYIVDRDGIDATSIEYDSEAGMFCIRGDKQPLTTIHAALTELVEHPDTLAATITEATAAGRDFHDA